MEGLRVNDKVEVENVNVPGSKKNVDAKMYFAMKTAILKVVPHKIPGINQTEIKEKVIKILPEDLFPEGQKAGWWAKTVQLDLEAKGVLIRDKNSKPLKWWQKK